MEDIAIIEDLKLGQLKRIADTLERLLKISEMSRKATTEEDH